MQQYPTEVRLVIRYAPFHQGSEQVVKLLESARRQDKYLAVLEAVLAAQPQWADHGHPNLELAYKAAKQAGLDMQRARADIEAPALDAVVLQDVQDLTALKVEKTPTFFVNGRPLPSFGHKQLADLVAQEVSKTKAQVARLQSEHGGTCRVDLGTCVWPGTQPPARDRLHRVVGVLHARMPTRRVVGVLHRVVGE